MDPKPEHCLCHSGKPYSQCCQPAMLQGAETPAALMRSRYTAFIQKDMNYLLETWHPETRPPQIDTSNIPDWFHVEILSDSHEGDQGTVEFIAKAWQENQIYVFHEISQFKKEHRWLYVTGEIIPEPGVPISTLSRNAPCPCHSGRKFKKCCLKTRLG